jgi:hypothetical protein
VTSCLCEMISAARQDVKRSGTGLMAGEAIARQPAPRALKKTS